jgi:hypothetical protein
MYKGPKNIKEKFSISEYIKGNDIFGSQLLVDIDALPVEGYYTISQSEYRIDLITSRIYGDSKYSQILLYYNRLTIDDLKRGTILKYPSLDSIEEMVRNISK